MAALSNGARGGAHVALIADGNARWAERHGLSVAQGHEAAADAVLARLADAEELGVAELTVYAFSTENWSRPAIEVDGLVDLLTRRVARDTQQLHDRNVRIRFIGRRAGLSRPLEQAMREAEELTAGNAGISLFVAINYGGRAEILDAARSFRGTPEQEFREFLYAPEMHDPDVIVRTGGERRLSNCLLWQAAYAELVFREELWPDFDRRAFEQALAEYSLRMRRFGGRLSAVTSTTSGGF